MSTLKLVSAMGAMNGWAVTLCKTLHEFYAQAWPINYTYPNHPILCLPLAICHASLQGFRASSMRHWCSNIFDHMVMSTDMQLLLIVVQLMHLKVKQSTTSRLEKLKIKCINYYTRLFTVVQIPQTLTECLYL